MVAVYNFSEIQGESSLKKVASKVIQNFKTKLSFTLRIVRTDIQT